MSITKISPSVVDFDAGITISTADNTDTLTLTSTDGDANSGPNLRLYRNSSSPADNDALGFVEWEGRNDNSQDVVYGQIGYYAADVSDGTEDSYLYINTIVGGTVRNRINAYNNEVVINEESLDSDFRVEGDGNTHALFVQASDDKVGIGVSDPGGLPLHLKVASGDNKLRQETAAKDAFTLGLDNSTGDTIIGTHALYPAVRFLNAGGIAFGSDTAAANALDDYEEGTWTPQILAGTTNPTGGSNLSARGAYVKIGNRVIVTFYIGVSWNNSPSGGVYVTNLPFTITNDDNNTLHFPVATYNYAFGSPGAPFLATNINAATVRLYEMGTGAWGAANFNAHVSSPLYISGEFSYFV